jgi:hypothetical protein
MATAALARMPALQPGVHRIYYVDEGQVLRAIHAVRGADGKYRPTGVEERISFSGVQAALSKAAGRPDLHPTELGFNELGAGAFRRKIKNAAKVVGKSKILKKIAKGVKTVAAFVPGASAVTASIDAGQMAAKGVRTVKKVVNRVRERSQLSGLPLEVVGAAKARLPAAAVAQAQQVLRANVKPTSAVAKTTKQALLRESRLTEASKALALVPANKQAQVAKQIGNRVDGYKVITPRGNTVWVSKSALQQSA